MYLLIKAYRKKDLSKLQPKKVLVTGSKVKPHFRTVLINPEKDIKKVKPDASSKAKTTAFVGFLFEKMLSMSLEKDFSKEDIKNNIKQEKYYSKLDEETANNLIENIYQSKLAMQQYYKGKKIEEVKYVGELESRLGLGYKADILIKAEEENPQAFENVTKPENIAISVKTIQGKEISNTRVRLVTIGPKIFETITNGKIKPDATEETIKNAIVNILPLVLEDKRFPNMVMFLADIVRKKMLFVKEKDLTNKLKEAIQNSKLYPYFNDGRLQELKIYDKSGKKLLDIESRKGLKFLVPYRKILELADEVKLEKGFFDLNINNLLKSNYFLR
jgi:hypothetical protein